MSQTKHALSPPRSPPMSPQQYLPARISPFKSPEENKRMHPGEVTSPGRRLFLSSGRFKDTFGITSVDLIQNAWHHFSSKAHGFSLDSSDLPPKNKLPVSVGTMGEAGPDPALFSSATAPPSQERDLIYMAKKSTLFSVSYDTKDMREGKLADK